MDGDSAVSALPTWAAGLFFSELVPVADAAGQPTPVWALARDRSAARISEQFKANAGDYHARYSASAHFEALFRQAMEGARRRKSNASWPISMNGLRTASSTTASPTPRSPS